MSGQGRISVGLTAALLGASAVVFVVSTANAVRPADAAVGWARESPTGMVTTEAALRQDPGLEGSPGALTGDSGLSRRGGGEAAPRSTSYPRASDDEMLEAVNQDVFMPDRRPPPQRYQLPSERSSPLPAEEPDPRRRRGPDIRVVGSAIAGGMALALIQVDDSVPLALRLGEEVEGYVLTAVDEESATLVGDSETLTLPVVAPVGNARPVVVGPQGATADRETIQAMQERVQQLLRAQMMNSRRQNPNRGGRGGGQ